MDCGFHQKLQIILNVKWEHEAQKSWLKCNKVSLFTQNQASPRNKKAPNPNINIIFPTILQAPWADFASCFTGSPWRQWPDRWVATSNPCPRALGLNSSAQWPWRWDGFLCQLRQLPPSFLNAEMECKMDGSERKTANSLLKCLDTVYGVPKFPWWCSKFRGMSLDQIYKNSPTLKEKIWGNPLFHLFSQFLKFWKNLLRIKMSQVS